MTAIRTRATVLGLLLATALAGGIQASPLAAATSVGPAGRAAAASSTADFARSDVVLRATPSLSARQRAAALRLTAAAREFHRIVDRVVRAPAWILEIQVLSDRADFVLAIRQARAVGLDALARRYQRVLDADLKRLDESRAFNALLARAATYGEHVAQKAHEDNPSLPPTVLGNIAVNAANWYGNDALLKVTLRAAKRKGPDVFEITVKKGADLDRRAYALYRALSVGARKTKIRYGGREGLHELPDAKGGFNGGLIGIRRAAETSGGKSPAIDIKTSNGTSLRIHVRHEP